MAGKVETVPVATIGVTIGAVSNLGAKCLSIVPLLGIRKKRFYVSRLLASHTLLLA